MRIYPGCGNSPTDYYVIYINYFVALPFTRKSLRSNLQENVA